MVMEGAGYERLTRVQFWGDLVEHVNIHVGMDSPVSRRVIASSNENRVSLSSRKSNEING